MKKAVLCSIIILLIAIPLVSAKDILYVAEKDAAGIGNCLDLQTDDKAFCERLEDLGYTIDTLDDDSVKQQTEEWTSSYDVELIFLGNVQESILTDSTFCENIKETGKKFFVTGNNAKKGDSWTGCAIDLEIVDNLQINNTVTQKKIKILDTNHYITTKLDSDSIDFYSQPQEIKVHDQTDIIGVYGNLADILQTYTAIKINPSSIFWGFDKPLQFTETAWSIFDRSIEFIMDDMKEDIIITLIPSKITKDEKFFVYAKTIEETNGDAEINYGTKVVDLIFDNETNYWKSTSMAILKEEIFEISIGELSTQKTITPGSIEINIISGSFSENYTIKATVSEKADVNYKLLGLDLVEYGSGELTEVDGIYKKEITMPTNETSFILEVTAINDNSFGGDYKKISESEIASSLYSIDPTEWIITTKKNETFTKTFRIGSGRGNLTNIKIKKSGTISSDIGIVTTDMATRLLPERYTTFKVNIDTNDLTPGKYTGSIIVEATEYDFEIPITLYFINTTGSWIKISPYVWNADVLVDKESKGTFTLSNSGIYPSTNLDVKITGTIHDIVSLLSQPSHVPSGGEGDLKLLVNGRNVLPGEYKGRVELSGAMGKTVIITTLNVIDEDDFEIEEVEERLLEIKETVEILGSEQQKVILQSILTNLNETKQNWEDGKYSNAIDTLTVVETNLHSLELEFNTSTSPTGTSPSIIVIVIGVIIAAFVLYFIYKYKDKFTKKPEKKKSKRRGYLPSEDSYRTEYY